jgi:alkaline phosphatase
MNYLINRRKFLQYSGALSGSALLSPYSLFSQEKPLITFGIVTDSHYAERDAVGTRHFRESLGKMKEAMEEMNNLNVDFVIHLGDFKDQDENPVEAVTITYLKILETAFASFRGPRYHVLGNHDTDSISKKQFLDNVVNTGIRKDKSYYSFDSNGIHFVVLDGDYKTDGTSYDKGNFEWTDTFIPEDQLTWLKIDLRKTKLPTIVFVHQLLDDVNDLDFCIKNASTVREALSGSKKVLAVFQGHRHEERYNKIENIHYNTLPGMVDYSGPGNNSFSTIEVFSNGDINMTGYQRAPSRALKPK